MVYHVFSMGLGGVEGYGVTVECCITQGLPSFDIVSLPDAAVRESRERVRASGGGHPVPDVPLQLRR